MDPKPRPRPHVEGRTIVLPEPWQPQGFGTCRSCGASVMWAKHARTGGRAPFSLDTGVTHFADCPNAAKHRKAKRG